MGHGFTESSGRYTTFTLYGYSTESSPQATPSAKIQNKTHLRPYAIVLLIVSLSAILLAVVILFKHKCQKRRRNNILQQTDGEELLEGDYQQFPLGEHGEALQVVSFNQETGHFFPHGENLRRILLHKGAYKPPIPLIVVSIAGPFRTGKSFLMNYILRYLFALEKGEEDVWMEDENKELTGFAWTHGTSVATYGVWMWSRPIYIRTDNDRKIAVLLMDTQGLFDMEHNPEASTLVTLSALLSDVQIYNTMEKIDDQDLKHYELLLKTAGILNEKAPGRKKQIIKRLIFLVRDRTPSDRFPLGSDGGKTYLNEITKPPIVTSAEFKHLSDSLLECFLMAKPYQPLAGHMSDAYKGELSGLSKAFQEGLREFPKILFQPYIAIEGEKYIHLNGWEDLYDKLIRFPSLCNAPDFARPETIFNAMLKEFNKFQLKAALDNFFIQINKEKKLSPKKVQRLVQKTIRVWSEKFKGEDSNIYKTKLAKNLKMLIDKKSPKGNEAFLRAYGDYRTNMKTILRERKIRSTDELRQKHEEIQAQSIQTILSGNSLSPSERAVVERRLRARTEEDLELFEDIVLLLCNSCSESVIK